MDNEERTRERMQTRKEWRLLIKSGKPQRNVVPTTRHHSFYFRICLAALVSKCLFCRQCVHIRRINPIKKGFYSLLRASQLQFHSNYNLIKSFFFQRILYRNIQVRRSFFLFILILMIFFYFNF